MTDLANERNVARYRPRGEPPKRLTVLVDPEIRAAVERASAESSQSMSLWVQEALQAHLGLARRGGRKAS